MFVGLREWSHRYMGMESGSRRKLKRREWPELGQALLGLFG